MLNKKDISLYKKFFHLLKEEHIMKEYIMALRLYNIKHNFFFDNFDEWLKFIENIKKEYNIEYIMNEMDIVELIYDMFLFCDWYNGDKVFEDLKNDTYCSWQDIVDIFYEKCDILYELKGKKIE